MASAAAAIRSETDARGLRQGIDHQRIGGDYGHVLFAVGALIRDWVGVASSLESCRPQLPAGLRLERAETIVIRRGDEHQATCRHDWTREQRPSGVLLPRRQLVGDAERHLPCERAGGGVDCRQPAPWWFLARQVRIADPDVEGAATWSRLVVGDRRSLLGPFD